MKSILCTFIVALFFVLGSASAQSTDMPASAIPALDSVSVQEFLGTYNTAGVGTISVTWQQGKMIGAMEGQGSAELKPTPTPDVMNIIGYEGIVTFIRNEEKKIIKLKLEVQGQVIEGEKQ
ncbi:MAG: hypothetical protein SFU99_01180 [Saprospiraceae bacterium]|nr:hypothetical protein [Saprospiraceae bacterium]